MTAVLGLMAASLRHGGGLCNSAMLTCLNHNYRNELARNGRCPEPIFVGKAQRFMAMDMPVPKEKKSAKERRSGAASMSKFDDDRATR
jgi:hypothetical protein